MVVWRVWKNNRIVGYTRAFTQSAASRQAICRYGDNVYVDRMYFPNN